MYPSLDAKQHKDIETCFFLSFPGTGLGYSETNLRRGEECIGALLAGQPSLPALLLAVGPGFQAVLLDSGQVRAHILVGVEHQLLQQAPCKTAGCAANTCWVEATFAACCSSGVPHTFRKCIEIEKQNQENQKL